MRDYLSRRYVCNFAYRRFCDGNITVHGIPRITPALFFRMLRRTNERLFSWFLHQLIRSCRIDVVVGTFVVPPPQSARLVFDLFDDNAALWQSRGRVPEYANEIAAIERAYVQRADAIVAASSVLADKAKGLGARSPVYHIPNGVDLSRFARANGASLRERLGVKGRLVGSVGNHDKLAELEKILEAARRFLREEVSFLIAGRGIAAPVACQLAQRQGLTNVIFQGYVPPEAAPDVIDALDVGLCAYTQGPGEDARSPMRLLMYAAAGVPTVCTELEEVRRMRFSNVLLAKDDAESFEESIRQALLHPRVQPSQIQSYDLSYLTRLYETVLVG